MDHRSVNERKGQVRGNNVSKVQSAILLGAIARLPLAGHLPDGGIAVLAPLPHSLTASCHQRMPFPWRTGVAPALPWFSAGSALGDRGGGAPASPGGLYRLDRVLAGAWEGRGTGEGVHHT
jgi:hypothetical protein